jgi:hypothetical protein
VRSIESHKLPPAGWYLDPDQDGGRFRWWDGSKWTGSTRLRDESVAEAGGLRGSVCDKPTEMRLQRMAHLYEQHAVSVGEFRRANEKILAAFRGPHS